MMVTGVLCSIHKCNTLVKKTKQDNDGICMMEHARRVVQERWWTENETLNFEVRKIIFVTYCKKKCIFAF